MMHSLGLALLVLGPCQGLHQMNYLASLEQQHGQRPQQEMNTAYQQHQQEDSEQLQEQVDAWSLPVGSYSLSAASFSHDRDYMNQHSSEQSASPGHGMIGDGRTQYQLLDWENPKVSSGKSFIYEAVPADSTSDPNPQHSVIVKLSSNLEALEREINNYERIAEEAREKDLFVQVHGYLPKANPQDEELQHQGALVMERGNKDLQTYVRKYGALQGRQLQEAAWTLARCVQAVHNSDMVWTELKAANFVVANPNPNPQQQQQPTDTPYQNLVVKAIDLESAVPQQKNLIDFSPEACPPEFLSEFLCGRETLVKVDKSFDIWSLGILFYKIATGKPYFNPDKKDGLAIALAVKKAQSEEGRLDLYKHVDIKEEVDNELRGLVKWCLEMDPSHRPNIDQVLLHPYFGKDDPQ